MHGGQEGMLIDPFISSHKVLLGFWPQKAPVWPQIKLLLGRRLPGHRVDDQEAILVGPQHGAVLLTASVHVGAVHEGRELVELLPGAPLAHGGGADKVDAGHGFIDLGKKWVSWWNFDVETSGVDLGMRFTAVK